MLNPKRKKPMRKFFSKAYTSVKKKVQHCGTVVKGAALGVATSVLGAVDAAAQTLAGTGYDAGTSALEDVATEIAKYVPYVVNLCYALAGVVAIVGAISVYISMNNEENDVKNILVHNFWNETRRKEMLIKQLFIKHLRDFLNFPILSEPILKKI